MKTAAIFFLLLFFAGTAAAGRPVVGPDEYGQIYIPAQRVDRVYQLKCHLASAAASGRPHRRAQDEYFLSKPITPEDDQAIRQSTVRFLTIANGAEVAAFDNPARFPVLFHVSLMSDRINEECLQSLAKNYPNIESLSVEQSQPMSASGLRMLSKFRHLNSLELYCPVEDMQALKDGLPASITSLQICQQLALPKLPHLEELCVRNCTLHRKFLEELQAPELTYMCLIRINPSRDFFKGLAHLKRLRKLSLTQTAFDHNDISSMLGMPYLGVQASQP